MKKTKSNQKTDLPETMNDKEHLEPDEGILDLPEVRDIPGQEHIHVPPLREYADTTISSEDEEGVNVFDKDDDEIETDANTNVSRDERQTLRDAAEKTPDVKDEKNLMDAQLDQRDEDGELLNERTTPDGSDLDIPGSEEDDADEDLGEEDEENNSYSLDNEDEDDSVSKQ